MYWAGYAVCARASRHTRNDQPEQFNKISGCAYGWTAQKSSPRVFLVGGRLLDPTLNTTPQPSIGLKALEHFFAPKTTQPLPTRTTTTRTTTPRRPNSPRLPPGRRTASKTTRLSTTRTRRNASPGTPRHNAGGELTHDIARSPVWRSPSTARHDSPTHSRDDLHSHSRTPALYVHAHPYSHGGSMNFPRLSSPSPSALALALRPRPRSPPSPCAPTLSPPASPFHLLERTHGRLKDSWRRGFHGGGSPPSSRQAYLAPATRPEQDDFDSPLALAPRPTRTRTRPSCPAHASKDVTHAPSSPHARARALFALPPPGPNEPPRLHPPPRPARPRRHPRWPPPLLLLARPSWHRCIDPALSLVTACMVWRFWGARVRCVGGVLLFYFSFIVFYCFAGEAEAEVEGFVLESKRRLWSVRGRCCSDRRERALCCPRRGRMLSGDEESGCGAGVIGSGCAGAGTEGASVGGHRTRTRTRVSRRARVALGKK
ncbi:hypothetical protein B0H16DRAFT_1734288 [Mycena metata]|uniref:Uncharacterized protein n=1 Tax=Mycena metata TaxID=1033252 RepID=A0AAD7HXJ1_9AGAR|nr:hypothetical protein B0H16DRAFT_1734288 [Mycena metata]